MEKIRSKKLVYNEYFGGWAEESLTPKLKDLESKCRSIPQEEIDKAISEYFKFLEERHKVE